MRIYANQKRQLKRHAFLSDFYIFFSCQGFLSETLMIGRGRGEGSGSSLFLLPLPPAHKHSEIYLQLGISINQNPNASCSVFIGALTKWTDSEIKASEQFIRRTETVVFYMW